METEQQIADRINAMPAQEYKVWENRLRRMARRQGLTLMKSRRRDPRAYDYNGYQLVDANNYIAAGEGYCMSLADVERSLTDDEPQKKAGSRKRTGG